MTKKSRRGDLPLAASLRFRIDHDHEEIMGSGFPPLIGSTWATAERSPPLLETGASRQHAGEQVDHGLSGAFSSEQHIGMVERGGGDAGGVVGEAGEGGDR